MKARVGFVLQGGGANGAYQAGVLYTLCTRYGVRANVITGTSVGALNGGFLAQYKVDEQHRAADNLREIWFAIKDSMIYKKWLFGLLWYLPALWKRSIFCTSPLRKLLRDRYFPNMVAESDVTLVIGAVSLTDGSRREWKNGECDAKVLEASASFPVAFEPVEIDGHLYTDDGVRETTPLEAAIKEGCDEIFVILNSRRNVKVENLKAGGLFQIKDFALRVIGLQSAEIEKWDLKVAELYNRIVCNGGEGFGKREVILHVIEPSEELGNSIDFGNKKATQNFALGQADAEAFVEKKLQLVPKTYSIPYLR